MHTVKSSGGGTGRATSGSLRTVGLMLIATSVLHCDSPSRVSDGSPDAMVVDESVADVRGVAADGLDTDHSEAEALDSAIDAADGGIDSVVESGPADARSDAAVEALAGDTTSFDGGDAMRDAAPAADVCADRGDTASCSGSLSLSLCCGRCVDLSSDPQNCGSCGTSCGACICTSGFCEGPPGLTFCSGTGACANLRTDPSNCGLCGHACVAGQRCVSGVCA